MEEQTFEEKLQAMKDPLEREYLTDGTYCTFSLTSNVWKHQHYYRCETCNQKEGDSICFVCATVCHHGHTVKWVTESLMFCDCGGGSTPVKCKTVKKFKKKKPKKTSTGRKSIPVDVPDVSSLIGMKLEARDLKYPSYICVATINDAKVYNKNPKILVHFDGWGDSYDYWTWLGTNDNIGPVGACTRMKHELQKPNGYGKEFRWDEYLQETKAKTVPEKFFPDNVILPYNSQDPNPEPIAEDGEEDEEEEEEEIIEEEREVKTLNIPNLQSVIGLKLEARDIKNPTLVCVATIKDVKEKPGKNPEVLVTFDGWGDEYDYWDMLGTSDNFGYIGTCKKMGTDLQKPGSYGGEFTWEKYLEETKAKAVPKDWFPADVIKPYVRPEQRKKIVIKKKKGKKADAGAPPEIELKIPNLDSLIGMKLEARDIKNPTYLCVASIKNVREGPPGENPEVLITFDGWSETYDYWTVFGRSDNLGYIGACDRMKVKVQKPRGYPTDFNWAKYLEESKAKAAPKEYFPLDIILPHTTETVTHRKVQSPVSGKDTSNLNDLQKSGEKKEEEVIKTRVVIPHHSNTYTVVDQAPRRLYRGHSAAVRCVLAGILDTPEGKQECLISSSDDSTIRLFKIKNGQNFQVLKGHAGSVGSLLIHRTGNKLYSGSNDSTLRVWDLVTGGMLKKFNFKTAQVTAMAKTKSKLFVGREDHTIAVFDIARDGTITENTVKRELADTHKEGAITSLAATETDTKVALFSASADGSLNLTVIDKLNKDNFLPVIPLSHKNKSFGSITTMKGDVYALKYKKNKEDLDSGSLFFTTQDKDAADNKERHVYVWKMTNFKPEDKDLTNYAVGGIYGNVNSIYPQQDRLFVGTEKKLLILDRQSGDTLQILDGHNGTPIYCTGGRGSRLFTGGRDGSIREWKTEFYSSTLYQGNSHEVNTVVSIDDDHFVTGSADSKIYVWNIKSTELVKIFEGHTGSVTSLIRSGNKLISGSLDQDIRIWDIFEGVCERVLHCNADVNTLQVVNSYLFAGSSDTNIRIWDLDGDDAAIKTWDQHQFSINCLELADDGFLYSGSDYENEENQQGTVVDPLIKKWDTRNIGDNFVLEFKLTNTPVTAIKVHEKKLYSASSDHVIRVWDTEKADLLHSFPPAATPVVSLAILENKVFCGQVDGTVWLKDPETGENTHVLRGHSKSVSCILVHNGDIITSSFDQNVRYWDLQILFGRNEFLNTYTEEAVQKINLALKDDDDRSLLMLLASYGLSGPARCILQTPGYEDTFFSLNRNGESAFYFALLNERWEFLKAISQAGIEFEGKKLSKNIIRLLKKKASTDESEYFQNLFSLLKLGAKNVHADRALIDIIAESFLSPDSELKILKLWISICKNAPDDISINMPNKKNRWTLLHFSCFYGCPKATALLLKERKIRLNEEDVHQNTPIHLAMVPNQDPLWKRRGLRSVHTLTLDRKTCAEHIIAYDELGSKADLMAKNQDLAFPYQLILKNYVREVKVLSRPSKAKIFFENSKETYRKTLELVALSNEHQEVKEFRVAVARKEFLRQIIPYAIWLIALIIAIIGQSTQNQEFAHFFSQSQLDVFTGNEWNNSPPKTFFDIQGADDYWTWFGSVLGPGLASMEWFNGTQQIEPDLITGHRLVGPAIVRQIRVKNDCKNVPKGFDDTIKACSPLGFDLDTSDWQGQKYTKGLDYVIWGKFGDYIPGDGFYFTVYPEEASTSQLATQLQQSGWIDSQTRAVVVSFTVYNNNLNFFSVLRLIVEFPPSGGQLIAYYDIDTIKGFKYHNNYDYFLLALEIFIVIFFLVEFVLQELSEFIKYRLEYMKELWNYYEQLCIMIFWGIIGLRFAGLAILNQKNLNTSEFVSFSDVSTIYRYESQLMSVFLIMLLLRSLKFFRIPEFSGIATRSILDTIKHRSFISFISLFIFVILSFAFSFHIAFGVDIFELRNIYQSIIRTLQMVFGDFSNYSDLEGSNRIFGPMLFLIFMFLVSFILMNLAIAILSEIYVTVSTEHKEFWERHLTDLVIELAISKEDRARSGWMILYKGTKSLGQKLKNFFLCTCLRRPPTEQEMELKPRANHDSIYNEGEDLTEMTEDEEDGGEYTRSDYGEGDEEEEEHEGGETKPQEQVQLDEKEKKEEKKGDDKSSDKASTWKEGESKGPTLKMNSTEIDKMTTEYFRQREAKSMTEVYTELKSVQNQIISLEQKLTTLTEGVAQIYELQMKSVQSDFSFFTTETKPAFAAPKKK